MFGNAIRRGHTPRYLFVAAAIVVLGAALLAGQALADSGSTDPSFRTAVVKRSSVSQTLQRSGTIEPVAQGTVAFPISGTVSTVAVQAGQTVTTGQTLATLDSTTLQATVASKQAALAAAQLTLTNALNGISSSPSNNAPRATTSTTPATTRSATVDAGALSQARRAVTMGKQQVDAALTTAGVALTQARSACASSSSTTSTTTAPPRANPSSDCVDALQKSLGAQQQVASAETALAQAQNDLDGLLNSAASTAPSSNSSKSESSSAASSSSGPSSAELVADQAAVDAAQAELTAAQQSLAQATIVSPIGGTVAAVNMAPGEQISAGSSTANIVVVGAGGYEVTTTVNVTDIGKVKLGNVATVTPDGSSTPLDGNVVSIGVVPTTSGNTTVYPVVIGLTGASSPDLHNGASAAVTIVLTQATDALTVPTSAVHSIAGGGLETVTVLDAGKTTNVPVQVGAIGAELTEIRSGLQEGQTVVLADLREPVPSNNTTSNGRGGFGGPGGGLGGGNATFIQRG